MFGNLFNFTPKPFDEGYLPETDGHRVYYYQYGNPVGIPVLSFHGGPGGSSRPKYAKLFDLKKYRFLQFDQRGCGLSQAKDLLYHNDTSYLLQDAMHLLAYLHIDTPIIVHGASWGSTMALLFAEAYPQTIRQIVVSSVFLARHEDYMWVNADSERFYPDLWAQMREVYKSKDIFKVHKRLLFSDNEADNLTAMSYWRSYEHQIGLLEPKFEKKTEVSENNLNSARIAFYYDEHHFFLNDNQILRNADKIAHIPAIIVHNRMDFCCVPKQAWDLHRALPKSQLQICGGYGHSTPALLKMVKKMIRRNEK